MNPPPDSIEIADIDAELERAGSYDHAVLSLSEGIFGAMGKHVGVTQPRRPPVLAHRSLLQNEGHDLLC